MGRTEAQETIRKDDLFVRIQDSIRHFFKCSHEPIALETVAFDINGWDSLAHAGYMLELEEDFDIKFSIIEILEFESVSSIVDAVYAHLINDSLPHLGVIPQLTGNLHCYESDYRTIIFEFTNVFTFQSIANNRFWEELEKDGFSVAGDQGVGINSQNNFVELPCKCNPKDQIEFKILLGGYPQDTSSSPVVTLLVNEKECASVSYIEPDVLACSFKARDHLGINAQEGENIFRVQFKAAGGSAALLAVDPFDAFIIKGITASRTPWIDDLVAELKDGQSISGESLWGNLWKAGGRPFLMQVNDHYHKNDSTGESCIKIHAIGDSHVIYNFAVYPECKIHYVGAYSVFHLIKNRFDLGDYGILPGQKVMFVFGEIDCRTIIGSLSNRIPPEELAKYLAGEYLKALNDICKPNDIEAAIVLPVPPFPKNVSTDTDFPVVGSLPDRVMYTRLFCAALRDLKGKGCVTGIIDAYAPFVDDNGVMDRYFASDEVHLRADKTDPLFAQAMEWIAQR